MGIRTIAAVLVSAAAVSGAQGPREIGSRRELFVDDWLIDTMVGTTLQLHRPVRRGVVFRFDAPWEGAYSAYVTVMKDGERFRMYYRGGGDLSREYTCLTESDDGIHWTRPSLGLFEFDGSKRNNIIWTGEKKAYWESHNFSPFKDDGPVVDASQRYKAVTMGRRDIGSETRRVLLAFVSPDGVHWRRLREEPIITEGSFDSHNVAFWDAEQGCYVCYLRQSRDGKRSIRRATSKDFIRWTDPEWLDFGDTPLEQFYTNGIMPYSRAPHLYLGFPMRFVPERTRVGLERRKTDGLSDAVFMSSRDGLQWDRTFMEAFIRPGLNDSNWGGAHGNNTPAWGMIQTAEDEISLYVCEDYGNYPEGRDKVPCLRRATIRTDGFVSVNAPYAGGEMLTKPLMFEGRTLTINCATSAVGSLKIEIMDGASKPVPGFTLGDSDEIYGDEIARTVSWKGKTDVSPLAGKPARLRFVMKDADLYALQFKP